MKMAKSPTFGAGNAFIGMPAPIRVNANDSYTLTR